MHQILKYPLSSDPHQVLMIPKGAEILCCQVQDGVICLWAKSCMANSYAYRKISIYGTGWSMSDDFEKKYIGTVQLNGYVWHVFDGGES